MLLFPGTTTVGSTEWTSLGPLSASCQNARMLDQHEVPTLLLEWSVVPALARSKPTSAPALFSDLGWPQVVQCTDIAHIPNYLLGGIKIQAVSPSLSMDMNVSRVRVVHGHCQVRVYQGISPKERQKFNLVMIKTTVEEMDS